MNRKTNIENYLLKRQLLKDKTTFPLNSLEIEHELKRIELEFAKVDDLPATLKADYRGSPKAREISGKKPYSKKVKTVLDKSVTLLSSREVLKELYKLFPDLNQLEDRKHMRMVSNVLNQGYKKEIYEKSLCEDLVKYGIKNKSL